MEAKERLYRTVDDRVVAAGDADARWLYAVEGGKIPDGDAAKYGIIDGLAPRPEPEPVVAKKPAKKGKK